MSVTDAPQEKSSFRRKSSRAPFETEPGRPHPLGATVDKESVNFSVFSRNATSVELLLFARHDDVQPIQIIKLEPPRTRLSFFGTSMSGVSSQARITPTASTDRRTFTAGDSGSTATRS